MRISIVTVCYNSEDTIKKCIDSVSSQSYPDIEHIIIDGNSSDSTVAVASTSASENIKIFSEADDGIYDAMNKGFEKATGEVIAYLNSDDYYAHPGVIRNVMVKFENNNIDYVYGDIYYVNEALIRVRSWVVGELKAGQLRSQQIPHPAFFCRRNAIQRLSIPFDRRLKICGDLKQQLYLINKHNARGCYINEFLTVMRIGGASTANMRAHLLGWKEAMSVYNEVEGRGGMLFVLRKVLAKLDGFRNH